MDGFGNPNHCQTNTSLGSGEQKKAVEEARGTNSFHILMCKASRSYQNELACIKNLKKNVLVIFCFSYHLIKTGNCKIP